MIGTVDAIETVVNGPDPCRVLVLGRQPGAVYSILFPHKISDINDDSLRLNVKALTRNSRFPHELILVLDPVGGTIDPYKAWNVGLNFVRTPYFIFHNSDLIVAEDWDHPYMVHAEPDRILTNHLVECGAMGTYHKNVNLDFGKCPRCFRTADFEAWAKNYRSTVPECIPGMGYYIQAMLPVELVRQAGGFPTDVPFMYRPNDALLFEAMERLGAKHYRVNSVAYHFQNLTARGNVCGCYSQASTRPN